MMTSLQQTVFVMLVACAVLVLVLPDVPSLIRVAGLGAVGAWLVVRPRRDANLRSHAMNNQSRTRRGAAPKVLTAEERERSIRSAGWYDGSRMAEGKTDRAGALEHMRDTVPGFPTERYEAELNEALDRIEEAKVGVRARRSRHVAEARELDLLNGVFALHYFNRRFSRHVGEYGLGQISLIDALGDLYTRGQIGEAVSRCDALIEEGIRIGQGRWDFDADMARLRQQHPGFGDRALGDALDWGRYFAR
jgi:hypothetical protein